MCEKRKSNQIILLVSKLTENEEYKLLLSELKTKAHIEKGGEPTIHLLSDNFGGAF